MKTDDLPIWAFRPVAICVKMNHVTKIVKGRTRGFCNDYGDISVCRINNITGEL